MALLNITMALKIDPNNNQANQLKKAIMNEMVLKNGN